LGRDRDMPVKVGGSKVADPRPARVLDLSPAAVVGDKARASSKKNRRRHKKASSHADAAASSISPMQRLFDTSREVFANSYPGFVPPPDAVARLSGLLSTYPAPPLPSVQTTDSKAAVFCACRAI